MPMIIGRSNVNHPVSGMQPLGITIRGSEPGEGVLTLPIRVANQSDVRPSR